VSTFLGLGHEIKQVKTKIPISKVIRSLREFHDGLHELFLLQKFDAFGAEAQEA